MRIPRYSDAGYLEGLMGLRGLGYFLIVVALLVWAVSGKWPAVSVATVALILCFGMELALKKTGAEK